METGNTEQKPQNPRSNANIFEILTFSWILNLFKTRRKRDLDENDLYKTLNDHTASLLSGELERIWKIELTNSEVKNQEPRLLKVLVKMFGIKILWYGSIQLFVEIVLRMSQPILIGKLLEYFNQNESNTIRLRDAYIYASGLILNIFFNIMFYHYSQMEMLHIGMKVRVACCSTIFKKALRLSKTSLNETTVGQIVNLLANDLNRFDLAFRFVHYLWIGPLVTIAVTYFLWLEIGVSSIFGVSVLIAFIPLQGWLGKKTSEFRLQTALRTDERVRLMNEIVLGIQVIKMYTWEKPFMHLVNLARKMEIEQLRKLSYIKVMLQSFKIFHTRLALFMSILGYILLGNYISTQKVYIIISYYSILMTTMTMHFPQGIGLVAEMLISIKRIQNFLLQDEKDKNNRFSKPVNISTDNDKIISTVNVENDETCNKNDQENHNACGFNLVVSNATAKWTSNQPNNSLSNINLNVTSGQLVGIIGPVGAGKSSLIQAILRELPLSEGQISMCGRVSYASQEPWLFNGSVQQNILFGSSMNKERYLQVVDACALKTDFEQLPFGDMTTVGERGFSLSGGQRSRINLARAVYKEADVYLLDDPLSAVDTHVGKHIFEKCIKDYLKEQSCILITHQTQYLIGIDRIVLMENGYVLTEGSYQELQSSGLDLTKFLGPLVESEFVSDYESCKTNTTENSFEVIPLLSRHSSIQSIQSSIVSEIKSNVDEMKPVKEVESRPTGNVSRSVYFSYISAGGNICKISFLMFILIFTQVLGTAGDFWMSYWVNLEDLVFDHVKIKSTHNGTTPVNGELFRFPINRQTCLAIYAILNVTIVGIVLVRCATLVSLFVTVSINLHKKMFNTITTATMYFFNINSSGRILNRFTKDLGAVDELLPLPIMDFVYVSLSLVGTIVVIGFINKYFMIPTLIIGVVCYYTVVIYLSTSRSVKRLELGLGSNIIAYLNASLQGLTTIRAFKAEDILSNEFDYHQDLHSSAWYMFLSTNEAFGYVLDMICFIYLIILIYSFLAIHNEVNGGFVGLVITQAINLTGALQVGVRQSAELENQMTSVERILQYTKLPQEASFESSPEKKPPKEWPNKGQIIFNNFHLRYSLDTPHVLKNINIKIQPMEKIGIVGRTGAGKSSLIAALFRLAINEGNIIIDDMDINELGLHDLRSKLSIIPQEPVLFSGTMRTNLDPFDEYPDHVLWNVLDEVELKAVIEDLPDRLNAKMSEGGLNFSVGQRQLICLARAIIRNNKIIVLDEATANVDLQTDALIQNTIRNKFRTCTVLTIAHRLNTVMDSDKLLVLDSGTIVEFDHPHNLLKNTNVLYKMAEQTGRTNSDLLHSLAAESYNILQMTRSSSIKLIDEAEDSASNKTA